MADSENTVLVVRAPLVGSLCDIPLSWCLLACVVGGVAVPSFWYSYALLAGMALGLRSGLSTPRRFRVVGIGLVLLMLVSNPEGHLADFGLFSPSLAALVFLLCWSTEREQSFCVHDDGRVQMGRRLLGPLDVSSLIQRRTWRGTEVLCATAGSSSTEILLLESYLPLDDAFARVVGHLREVGGGRT